MIRTVHIIMLTARDSDLDCATGVFSYVFGHDGWVTAKNEAVSLMPNEYAILEYLIDHGGNDVKVEI